MKQFILLCSSILLAVQAFGQLPTKYPTLTIRDSLEMDGTAPEITSKSSGTNVWRMSHLTSPNRMSLRVWDGAAWQTPMTINKYDSGNFVAEEYNVRIGMNDSAAVIRIGNLELGTSDDRTISPSLTAGGTVFFGIKNTPDGPLEFVFTTSDGNLRFVIPIAGDGYGTYNARSGIYAGPSVKKDSVVIGRYWGFNRLWMNTTDLGADLGIQNNVQIGDSLFVNTNITVGGEQFTSQTDSTLISPIEISTTGKVNAGLVNHIINVASEPYNAIGNDGSSDDVAFTAALADLTDGMRFEVPGETFELSIDFDFSNFNDIEIEGNGATILFTDAAAGPQIDSSNNVVMRNFTFNHQDILNSFGISITHSNNVTLENVVSYNSDKHLGAIYGCDSVWLNRCQFIRDDEAVNWSTNHGLDLDKYTPSTPDRPNHYIWITNSVFRNPGGNQASAMKVENTENLFVMGNIFFDPIALDDDGTEVLDVDNVIFQNNQFRDTSAISMTNLDKGNITISDNLFWDGYVVIQQNDDKLDTTSQVNVTGNTFRSVSKDIAAIKILGDGNTNVANNVIQLTHGTASGYGIHVVNVEAGQVNVVGNIIRRTKQAGIFFQLSTGHFSNISANVIDSSYDIGIWIKDSDDIVLSNNIISNCSKSGIKTETSNQMKITGNLFSNNAQDGVAGRAEMRILTASSIEIQNNRCIRDAPIVGIDGIYLSNVDYSLIQNNNIINEDEGIYFHNLSTNNRIEGNTVKGCASNGILLTSTSNTHNIVSNNLLIENGDDGLTMDSHQGSQVLGNYAFANGQRTTSGYGIHLIASDFNSIQGNTVRDFGTARTYNLDFSNPAADTVYVTFNPPNGGFGADTIYYPNGRSLVISGTTNFNGTFTMKEDDFPNALHLYQAGFGSGVTTETGVSGTLTNRTQLGLFINSTSDSNLVLDNDVYSASLIGDNLTVTGNGNVVKTSVGDNMGFGQLEPDARYHFTVGDGTVPALDSGEDFIFQNNDDAADISRINILAGASGWSILNFGDTGDNDPSALRYDHTNSLMDIRIGGATTVRLKASETVLIGTTTDDFLNKLIVDGRIRGTQFRLTALNTAPSSASDTGTLGEIRIDANHIYVCTATDTWVRVAITTW